MSNTVTSVYFMPGMAASSRIFEYIKLPKDKFECFYLEWLLPIKNESLSDYAKRMVKNVKHDNCILVGVSFGGVLVQEMAKHIKTKKVIIISSIKSNKELPFKFRIIKLTKLYKVLPTQIMSRVDLLAKFAVGNTLSTRVSLYEKYMSRYEPEYLNWAIKEMVCWNRVVPQAEVVHIHGDADAVFPIRKIKKCITIEGGSHIMIMSKYRKINALLPKVILN